jgi:hypothetical protein
VRVQQYPDGQTTRRCNRYLAASVDGPYQIADIVAGHSEIRHSAFDEMPGLVSFDRF